MAALSDKELQIIKNLNKIEQDFRLNTNQNILNKRGLTERILEFQKPVIDEIKQVPKNLLLEKPEQSQAVTYSNKKPRYNNSYFTPKQKTGDFILFDMNGVDKLKLNSKTDELEILKPDGTSTVTKLTEGLKVLLFESSNDLDTSLITEDDIEDYFRIHQELKNDPGSSARMKNIRSIFPDISRRYPIGHLKDLAHQRAIQHPGSGVTQIDLTNKSPVELYYELAILKASKLAGNTNTLGKANAILDRLKALEAITNKKYHKILNYFIS